MNPAYKHLQDKLKLGEFTIVQWVGLVLSLLMMIVCGSAICPHLGIHGKVALVMSIYVGFIFGGPIIAAGYFELNLLRLFEAILAFKRTQSRYKPGPGESFTGYVIDVDPDLQREEQRSAMPPLDLAGLWES
jgi:hypothetical protein